jgi:beta-phosphoglucomutase-like phosphatase (HAD superfamily)
MGIEAVFIDDGGVLSDNARRAPEWQRLVGEVLSPRLGGAPEAWASANRRLVPPLWRELFGEPLSGRSYHERYETYLLRWLWVMCDEVGVNRPSRPDSLELAWEATRFITANVTSTFPGVGEAVVRLVSEGLVLHTASNEASWELEGYLAGAGVREHFGILFGTDLTGEFKDHSPAYYRAMFRLADVDPAKAVVVDDSPAALAQAAALGANTVLVDANASDPGLPGVVMGVLDLIATRS